MPFFEIPDFFFKSNAPTGSLKQYNIYSYDFNYNLSYIVYLPPSYSFKNKQRYPVIYLQDGFQYLEKGKINVQMENMVQKGLINEAILILLNPVNRENEYVLNPKYISFIVNQIVPLIDSSFRTISNKQNRIIGGSSYGGLTSLYITKNSNVFGNLILQSAALYPNDFEVLKNININVNTFITVGTFESLTSQNRNLRDALGNNVVFYKEVNCGHNWTNWLLSINDFLYTFLRK